MGFSPIFLIDLKFDLYEQQILDKTNSEPFQQPWAIVALGCSGTCVFDSSDCSLSLNLIKSPIET